MKYCIIFSFRVFYPNPFSSSSLPRAFSVSLSPSFLVPYCFIRIFSPSVLLYVLFFFFFFFFLLKSETAYDNRKVEKASGYLEKRIL